MSGLLQRWRALAGAGADDVGEALIRAWDEPQRHYHARSHLIWLLDEVDRRLALIQNAAFVRYAIWFHDAIYQPGRSDNEVRSADWAREALKSEPSLASHVGAVIEQTGSHWMGEAEDDAALFLDMDIAILGAEREVYRQYAVQIRTEFAQFPEAAYIAGRSTFLKGAIEREVLFRTPLYRDNLDVSARENMRRELSELLQGRLLQ
ncbi:MAG: metal-dependent phosphohydrolase [Proteobacteria bacterium]|nr:metal-dependent phosphohydrolase [Pseudomonadota bacterium]